MRRYLHIVVAAFLAAMCVIPAAGQSYKASKVREKSEPEPLTFSRNIDLELFSDKKFDPNLSGLLRDWKYSDGNDIVEYIFHNDFDDDNFIQYHGSFYNLQASEEPFNLVIWFKLHYRSPYRLVLEGYDITAFGKKDPFLKLSAYDDKFNRTWLWRVSHNIETVDKQREIAKECFNRVADSIEVFLKDGPPWELQLVD